MRPNKWADRDERREQEDDLYGVDERVTCHRIGERLAKDAAHGERRAEIVDDAAQADRQSGGRRLGGAPGAERQAAILWLGESHRRGERSMREQSAAESDRSDAKTEQGPGVERSGENDAGKGHDAN